LGAEGRGFESLRPDQHKLLIIKTGLTLTARNMHFAAVAAIIRLSLAMRL
jgi:hypothetical protein